MAFSLGELAERLSARLIGEAGVRIERVASLEAAGGADLAFAMSPRYREALARSRAGAFILSEDLLASSPAPALVVANPHLAFARAAELLHPRPVTEQGIHPSAVVHPEADIAAGVYIGPLCHVDARVRLDEGVRLGPGCHIGPDVRIGAGTELVARVTVLHAVRIGARCLIHPGVVIGSDGFGLANDRGCWVRVPQLGTVLIGDDVDIGANTTIDRGALEDTVIEDGVKLDNLIQVAHNVFIGAHSAVAGCAGIAGSSRIGRHCMLAGGVGLAGHLELADGVQVTGMSMVTRSIHQKGVYSAGTPLDTNRNWQRNAARFKQLDRMARRIAELERRLGLSDNEED